MHDTRDDQMTTPPRADEPRKRLAGTYRARTADETWEIIAPQLYEYGITRVADVTDLDIFGVPVAMAARPLSQTLSVSQGKGVTMQLARVSAAMEAIEFWHAEEACPTLLARNVSAEHLELPYDVTLLDCEAGSLLTSSYPLDWVAAVGLQTAEVKPVPLRAVSLADDRRTVWQPPGLRASTNGLASGNTRAEAVVHALYELIERDIVASVPAGRHRHVRPETLGGQCAELADRFLRAGAYLEIRSLPNQWDVFCFAVRLWSEDFPVMAVGYGAHAEAAIALSRALSESAQSRLTAISGSRDDITAIYRQARSSSVRRPDPVPPGIDWAEVHAASGTEFPDFATEQAWLSASVTRVTGHEPLTVDLSTSDDFSVVKVLALGAGFDGKRGE
ncbi:YcaO-like family protein [Kitasatospora sp. NPDC057692]|uniref:YcaO-like family protein n=1 Tax=Kitasatospora sp. NPDC057692 TaxID=3346215 RepID=UPI0036A44F80